MSEADQITRLPGRTMTFQLWQLLVFAIVFVGCNLRPVATQTCSPTGYLPIKWDDCHFHDCETGNMHPCPSGMYFNSSTFFCEVGNCTRPFCIAGSKDLCPYPGNTCFYVDCNLGVPSTCPSGTHYDIHLRCCVQGDCEPPSSPSPSTTSPTSVQTMIRIATSDHAATIIYAPKNFTISAPPPTTTPGPQPTTTPGPQPTTTSDPKPTNTPTPFVPGCDDCRYKFQDQTLCCPYFMPSFNPTTGLCDPTPCHPDPTCGTCP